MESQSPKRAASNLKGTMRRERDNVIDAKMHEPCSQLSEGAANFGASFFISGILAIVFKTMTAPLERIKLILQTQASSRQIAKSERSAYSGFLNAIVRIPKEQGFLSLWRGNFLNICRYFPAQAINFSCFDLFYDGFRQMVEPRMKNSHTLLPFLAGGAVGMTSCAILYPLTFCNTRISVDVGDNRRIQREFQSLNDCLRKVQRNDGYKGFYQGVTFSATGMFLYREIGAQSLLTFGDLLKPALHPLDRIWDLRDILKATYFGVYTIGKRAYLNDRAGTGSLTANAPIMVSLLIAQFASMVATLIAYPLDTISRQKMLWSGRGPKNYASMRQVVAMITHKDGVLGFYRGVFTNLLTTVCGSLLLVSYDLIKERYDKFEESKAASKS